MKKTENAKAVVTVVVATDFSSIYNPDENSVSITLKNPADTERLKSLFSRMTKDETRILRNQIFKNARSVAQTAISKLNSLQEKLFKSRIKLTFVNCADFFNGTKSVFIPLHVFMDDTEKADYNAIALSISSVLYDAILSVKNGDYSAYVPALKKAIFKASKLISKDAPISGRINDKDVNVIIQSSIKVSRDGKGFQTLNEPQTQAIIESMLYNKLQINEYAVKLYSRNKDKNGIQKAIDVTETDNAITK